MECKYCSKVYDKIKAVRSHETLCKDNPNRNTSVFSNLNKGSMPLSDKTICPYCNEKRYYFKMERHKKSCKSNPKNIKICINCKKQFTGDLKSKTCSYSCSNTYFKHKRIKIPKNYRIMCFRSHKKICVVCGEKKIVSVHHIDHNHHNNSPENLVPLCPTHHQYIHSKYVNEVQPFVDEYIEHWKNKK